MKKTVILSFIALAMNIYGESSVGSTIDKLRMKELAETYSKEKVMNSLKGYKDLNSKTQEALAQKAVLVDLNVITVEDLNNSEKLAGILKAYTEDYLDMSENFLGNISDKGILERINKKWSQAAVIEDSPLLDKLNEALAKGLTTGYNLKNKKDYANFGRELSLSYGHNNIIHSAQLIALMKSEGIDAKIQLEPKTSAFLHMPEWGEASKPNRQLKDGKIVITPLEYDLQFEFADKAEKIRFIQAVNRYAKKDAADQKGLIFKAWWQPFMQTSKIEGFMPLTVNIVSEGDYEAFVLTLPEKSKALIDELKKDSTLEIRTEEVYVNPAFYRFMLGEHK